MIGALVLYFIVYLYCIEKLMLGKLQKEFKYFRSVYKYYMPDAIIMKEKRIKFWLIKHKMLNK